MNPIETPGNPFGGMVNQLQKGTLALGGAESEEHQYSTPITYDRHGRMNYHPEIHLKQMEPWSIEDQAYLIENYVLLGPEKVSFALERTIHTVMTRAYDLRKKGVMPKPTKRVIHKRLGGETARASRVKIAKNGTVDPLEQAI